LQLRTLAGLEKKHMGEVSSSSLFLSENLFISFCSHNTSRNINNSRVSGASAVWELKVSSVEAGENENAAEED
jgi:hypothetical protein